ncbi:MAG: DNA/RNA nuclease SfsA [Pseudohongiellaceae bacterium]
MIIGKELQKGALVKRYKRFLADIKTGSGKLITIHCPNTGAMTNCQEQGSEVWYSTSENPKRKYPHTWEVVVDAKGAKIGINTGLANPIVKEGITRGVIAELDDYASMRTEVKYGEQGSRIDILLENPLADGPSCYVEVKNVSLCLDEGAGYFPDAVTTRGQKHLRELMFVRKQGQRAVLLFCVQHSHIKTVSPADSIDPDYGKLLRQAVQEGVEVYAYGADFDFDRASIELLHALPIKM